MGAHSYIGSSVPLSAWTALRAAVYTPVDDAVYNVAWAAVRVVVDIIVAAAVNTAVRTAVESAIKGGPI